MPLEAHDVSEIDSFLQTLEEGEIPSVVAMGGAERIFIDDALAAIRRRVLDGAIAEFNHDRVNAKQQTGDEVVALATTLPTFAPRRLVEVHDADDLDEGTSQKLLRYLEAPLPESVVVFVFRTLDLRSKLAKALKKAGLLCRFEHPKERDLPDLIRARVRRHRLRLHPDAVQALALTVGTDLGLLERALEKLALVAADREIMLEDISEHVADTHLEDAFRLARAVADLKRVDAIQSLAALERARAVPLQLVGLLGWQLRQLIRARDLVDAGVPTDEIGKTLQAFGPRARALVAAARKLEPAAHQRRLVRLAEVDHALKRSRVDGWLLMQRLILELCPEAPGRRAR